MNKTLKVLSFIFLSGLVMTACNKDDENTEPADVIASFQYEISAENWSDVAFTNYSLNATTYAWDFGDPTKLDDTSTLKNAFYSYGKDTATYTITLIVKSDK